MLPIQLSQPVLELTVGLGKAYSSRRTVVSIDIESVLAKKKDDIGTTMLVP
jgi:hypothetical protein